MKYLRRTLWRLHESRAQALQVPGRQETARMAALALVTRTQACATCGEERRTKCEQRTALDLRKFCFKDVRET